MNRIQAVSELKAQPTLTALHNVDCQLTLPDALAATLPVDQRLTRNSALSTETKRPVIG